MNIASSRAQVPTSITCLFPFVKVHRNFFFERAIKLVL